MSVFKFTLAGAPMTGTNSKRIVRFGNRAGLIKSQAALSWQAAMVGQLVVAHAQRPAITTAVGVTLYVYRVRNTGDTDNFVKPVLDALQSAAVLVNDRLVSELHVYRRLDKHRPRVEISITELAA